MSAGAASVLRGKNTRATTYTAKEGGRRRTRRDGKSIISGKGEGWKLYTCIVRVNSPNCRSPDADVVREEIFYYRPPPPPPFPSRFHSLFYANGFVMPPEFSGELEGDLKKGTRNSPEKKNFLGG